MLCRITISNSIYSVGLTRCSKTMVSRATLTVLASLLLAGCPLEVIVSSGGDVVSSTGNRDCGGGNTCVFDVSDTNFNEAFTAVPRDGYEFVKWQSGNRLLCGGLTDPTCTIDLTPFAGN